VESLLNIVLQASTGVIPLATAKALAEAAFPFIDATTLQKIFGTIEVKPVAVEPNTAPAPDAPQRKRGGGNARKKNQ
jgi:hypothetical protein